MNIKLEKICRRSKIEEKEASFAVERKKYEREIEDLKISKGNEMRNEIAPLKREIERLKTESKQREETMQKEFELEKKKTMEETKQKTETMEKGIEELIDAVCELRKEYPKLQLYLGGSWVDQDLRLFVLFLVHIYG